MTEGARTGQEADVGAVEGVAVMLQQRQMPGEDEREQSGVRNVEHDPPESTQLLTFADIYHRHVDFVWRTARRMSVAPSSLDDVVQDVFVVVHRRLVEYDGRAPMRGWLYGITHRVVSDHRRTFRRKQAFLSGTETNEHGEERFASTAPPPSANAERAESIALLEGFLAQLTPEKAEVLVLAHLEQLTVPEIAEGIGVNLNTVYSRLRAARRELEELVTHHDPRRQP